MQLLSHGGCWLTAMASAALRAWEAVIKHLQTLSSDDLPVQYGLTPGVVMSAASATSLDNALRVVRALPQGNKASCSKLVTHKVCCWQGITQARNKGGFPHAGVRHTCGTCYTNRKAVPAVTAGVPGCHHPIGPAADRQPLAAACSMMLPHAADADAIRSSSHSVRCSSACKQRKRHRVISFSCDADVTRY